MTRIRPGSGGIWFHALPAILLLAVATSFTFVNSPAFLDFAINADTLYPALLAEALRGDVTSVLRFQPARIPSFIPDLLIAVGVDLLSGSWRLAFWFHAAAAFAMLSLLGGYVASRLRRQDFWASALGLAVTMTCVLELGLLHFVLTAGDPVPEVFDDRLVVNLYVLLMMPAWHSGAFIAGLAVVALAWASRREVSVGRLGGLLVLTCLAAASNALVIVYAVLPAGLALGEGAARRRIPRRSALAGIAALAGGAGAGHLLGFLSGRRGLPLPVIDSLADNAGRALALLPRQPVMLLTLAACLAVAAACLSERWVNRKLAPRADQVALRFFLVVGAGAGVAGILVTLPLYISDAGMNWRYAAPAAWWPIILAIGVGGQWLSRWAAPVAAGVVMAAVGLVGFSAMAGGTASPAILRWRHPAAACLDRADPGGELRAGFASFWHGRTIAASGNWRRQVESTDFGAGRPILWTDDPRSWVQQAHGPTGRAPPFRFIVLWRHDPDALRRIHGAPAEILPCGDTPIWVYPAAWQPLDQLIAMADELVPQALAVGRRVCLAPGVADRAVVLPRGQWRIRRHYRLAADSGAIGQVEGQAGPFEEITIAGPRRVALDSLMPSPPRPGLTVTGYSIAPSPESAAISALPPC